MEIFRELSKPKISSLNQNTIGKLVNPDGSLLVKEVLIRRIPVENSPIFDSLAHEYAEIGFTDAGGKFRRRTPKEQFNFAKNASVVGLNVLSPLIVNGNITYIPYLDRAKTLDKYLPEATPSETARVVSGLFYDMQIAHSKNIIYGDRWSQNILVRPDKPPTHIDFDLEISGYSAKTFEVAQMIYYVLCAGRENSVDPVVKVLSNFRDWYDSTLLNQFLRGHAKHFSKSQEFGNAEEITDRVILISSSLQKKQLAVESNNYDINTRENRIMKDKLKLVIFDFDGLMVNSEQVVYDALKIFYEKYGHNLSWEYFCEYIGVPVQEALGHFYKDFPIPLSFDEFLKERNKIVLGDIEKKLSLMPDLLELLEYLKNKNLTMTIASSAKKEYINEVLDRFEIGKYFQTIVCIDDVKRGKPHPDLIYETLKRTNFSPDEALMLEDSLNGIRSARNAGVSSIAIPTKGIPLEKFEEADIATGRLKDLLNLI